MGKKKQSKKATKRRDDELKAIARAERKLAKAIAEADEARAKVSRREQQLAETLARYGHELPATETSDAAIPLEAPSPVSSENGVGHGDDESSDELVDVDAVEQH